MVVKLIDLCCMGRNLGLEVIRFCLRVRRDKLNLSDQALLISSNNLNKYHRISKADTKCSKN